MIQVLVDEATRFCTLTVVEFKNEDSLSTAFRRAWVSLFGPPRIFKCDHESAYASENFGNILCKYNCERVVRVAGDSHSWFGVLDRRVQLLRVAYPKVVEELSHNYLIVDAEDVVAELQFCVNTQLFYNGFSPYETMFGVNPTPVLFEEAEHVMDIPLYYEHQLVRAKALSVFHQSLIVAGLNRCNSSRPRKFTPENLRPGTWVDIWRRAKKNESGWRGPAVIIGIPSEGFVTVRFQSTYLDIPLHHVRPHYNVTPNASLESGPAPAPAIANAVPSEVPAQADALADNVAFAWVTNGADFDYELDTLGLPNEFYTLASLAAQLERGTQLVHSSAQGSLTSHALRDGGVTLKLGLSLANHLKVPHFSGVLLGSGRRYAGVTYHYAQMHCFYWSAETQHISRLTAPGSQLLDFSKYGIDLKDIAKLQYIVLLEGKGEGSLLEILDKTAAQEEEPIVPNADRVRIPITTPADDNSSVSSRRLSDFEEEQEVFHAQNRCSYVSNLVRGTLPRSTIDNSVNTTGNQLVYPVCDNYQYGGSSSSSSSGLDEDTWFFFKFEGTCPGFYPVNRDVHELTAAEQKNHSAELTAAQLKELASWVKHSGAKPILKSDYKQRTRLDPIDSRWILTFKWKSGKLIIKARLVLKGFQERNANALQTASPTATRTSHKRIMHKAALHGFEIWSTDVSAAFLRGFKITDLPTIGMSRQPVAFKIPDANFFKLLAQLDPVWKQCLGNPALWCIETATAPYGLKDAPLLWYLKFSSALVNDLKLG